MKSLFFQRLFATFFCVFAYWAHAHGDIRAKVDKKVVASFDIVQAQVKVRGSHLVFRQRVRGKAGAIRPTKTGKLAGSDVFSYVWPTNMDSSVVGFPREQGILALVLTAHPDFDDTPLYDENDDGNKKNDGYLWHSHWVVLTRDDACGKGALKVKDIPKSAKFKLPVTWPGLPIFIDSPGYEPTLQGQVVEIKVPLKDIGFNTSFKFDGVTAGLRINQSIHNPLLCVVKVHDIASGNLSLPGKVK